MTGVQTCALPIFMVEIHVRIMIIYIVFILSIVFVISFVGVSSKPSPIYGAFRGAGGLDVKPGCSLGCGSGQRAGGLDSPGLGSW